MIKHGIYVQESATALTVPKESSAGIQVVIGTAPVNTLDEPSSAVNVPILATKATEAMARLGYSAEFDKYTLCQTMYVTANMYQVQPVVYINVLDPKKHKKALAEAAVAVSSLEAVVEQTGVLKSGLVVKYEVEGEESTETVTAVEGTDYTLAFDDDGYLVVTLIAGRPIASASEVKVSGYQLDPSAVTYSDVIGSYNSVTGAETGMEVIRQVYPKLGVVPGILLAPGWSHIPAVGIALAAKAVNINGCFKAVAVADLPTDRAKLYTDVKEVKEYCGFASEYLIVCWPQVTVGDYRFPMSAVFAARMAYYDADEREDVPSASPSNISLAITGTCLADGTEVMLDQDQATVVNGYGVVTAFNNNGFRLWGNYTAAYPSDSDAKNLWISVRRMFNWQGNNFILTYYDKVDDPMNRRLIENIVDSENIRCAGYVPEHWAGATIEYLEEDNSETDILAGRLTFRQHIAPYTPAQTITNILDYDVETLASALRGGEE